mmetsp:Transcript_58863/g.140409  ORF Transcript_58863/g.140409 Transcript_58863/m.140409 type:complete len:536 (-) Transcript_58863:67-1674(-)|eukprot:CAMPEP_0178432036 /NCGR_PEP_ID=MMETSP0689_2-20121128/32170_1 /TAXON_ID=160604 /ORGANISM="Amphidinium massartii, Strain CS-259" /LENGTH=535 /DNA_ID=CAMNT_0020053995 /DNA_START=137 /DNA_END=1744 /DNA_ORIENTATION=-
MRAPSAQEESPGETLLPKSIPKQERYGSTGTGGESIILGDVMASMPLRRFHIIALVFFAVVKGSVASLYEMSPLVLSSIASEFQLEGSTVALVSTLLLGAGLVGSITAAPCADLAGRWWTLTSFSSLAVVFGFCQGVLVGPFRSYKLLLVLRALLGVCFGAVVAVTQCYLVEFLPLARRGFLLACVALSWQAGTLYCLLVAHLLSHSWRLCLMLSAAPFILVVAGMLCYIPESPRWLLLHKKRQKAKDVLKGLGVDVPGSLEVVGSPRFSPRAGHELGSLGDRLHLWKQEVKELFKPGVVETTIVIWGLWFCVASSNYTLSVWKPVLLMNLLGLDAPPTNLLAAISVACMVTHMIMALLIDRTGRKAMVTCAFATSGVLFLAACLVPSNLASSVLLIIGYVSLELAWTPISIMTIEIFPTSCRVTAMGMCMVLVRLSAAVTPTLLGHFCFKSDSTSISVCIGAAAALALAGAGFGAMLPNDTTNIILQDIGVAECARVKAGEGEGLMSRVASLNMVREWSLSSKRDGEPFEQSRC